MSKILIDEATVRLALEALEPFITPNWAGRGVDEANAAYTALNALAEQPAQRKLLTLQELEAAWNAQADHMNTWDELGLDEIVAWAQASHNIKENT